MVTASGFLDSSPGCGRYDSFSVIGLASVSIARQAQAHTRDADEASHRALPPLAEEASEEAGQVQGTRDIIHRYIMLSEGESGSPFALWESRQQLGQ